MLHDYAYFAYGDSRQREDNIQTKKSEAKEHLIT